MYVDDILTISQYAVSEIKEVANKFKLEKDKIEPPEIYLRGLLLRKEFNDNQLCTISSVKYVKELLNNLEDRLKKQGMKLPSRGTTQTLFNDIPKLDAKVELDANNITMF